MTENISPPHHGAEDAELASILRRYDPVAPSVQGSLAQLETDILAKIDGLERNPNTSPVSFPVWTVRQIWTARAAACAAVLVVMSGFIVGQMVYGESGLSAFSAAPSLMALTDETLWQSVSATDNVWGDSDDSAD